MMGGLIPTLRAIEAGSGLFVLFNYLTLLRSGRI